MEQALAGGYERREASVPICQISSTALALNILIGSFSLGVNTLPLLVIDFDSLHNSRKNSSGGIFASIASSDKRVISMVDSIPFPKSSTLEVNLNQLPFWQSVQPDQVFSDGKLFSGGISLKAGNWLGHFGIVTASPDARMSCMFSLWMCTVSCRRVSSPLRSHRGAKR